MTRTLSRQRYLEILHAALATHQYRFARQAALDWLSIYPGDLAASLYYGQALLGENRLPQAIAIFQGIRRADPEFIEAVEALVAADGKAGGTASISARTHYLALTGRSDDRRTLASWGGSLWLARQALDLGNLEQAGELIGESLRDTDNIPLVGVLHLRYLAVTRQTDREACRETALGYHQRWPDCIACMLWLAQWSMEIGEADYAVALLHQAVSRDVGGQVVQRLWGAQHPYRALWPANLELSFSLPIPADVTAYLGWNRLPAGAQLVDENTPLLGQPAEQVAPESASEATQEDFEAGLMETLAALQTPELSWALAESDGVDLPSIPPADTPVATPGEKLPDEKSTIWSAVKPQVGATALMAPTKPVEAAGGNEGKAAGRSQSSTDPDLSSIGQELDRLARKLKLPAVGRQDGRFPVYVVFSVRRRLEAVYGGRIADLLVSEMQALVETVDRRKGWSARLFMPDEPALLAALGLSPLRSIDPWELKLALADLDAALSRRGERIGALLIVGGPEIVPFHHLPNPVDDQDEDVPTDNPYSTRDENYFVPEWPVGRLPGGKDSDGRMMLETLARIRAAHEVNQERLSWLGRLARWLRQRLGHAVVPASQQESGEAEASMRPTRSSRPGGRAKAFGYTAAIWKQAASLVFRPIGKPGLLSVSPPCGIDGSATEASQVDEIDATGRIPALNSRLAYFNLHGLIDSPEWYGQRDPATNSADPDYPVALRPKDILVNGKDSYHETPQVIFSEACYGLHIQDREIQQAISLSFLRAGSLAVVGSTSMAYGSLELPLVAADLLGHTFWRYLQAGFVAGEALRQAKIHLASVMSQRQGYLDGEDQKTLISFILYGDPLAQPVAPERAPKSLRYQTSSLAQVPIVCERTAAGETADPLPPEMMASVKRVVARHLPGMSDARLTVAHPRTDCPGEGHDCPTSQLDQPGRFERSALGAKKKREPSRRGPWYKSKNLREDGCSLVTLSKQVSLPNGNHPRVARLTLDERGKLVKLVVSR